MGIHYFRPDLMGITEPPSPRVKGNGTYTDFRKPAILVYEPQGDGALQLVAVENLVFADAWKAAGYKEPPTFHAYRHMTSTKCVRRPSTVCLSSVEHPPVDAHTPTATPAISSHRNDTAIRTWGFEKYGESNWWFQPSGILV